MAKTFIDTEKRYSKTEFFEKFGTGLVKVHSDDTETGDFQLFSPEESEDAQRYKRIGFVLASVFDNDDEEDFVIFDNDTSDKPNKIGFLVLDLAHLPCNK